MNQSFSLPNSRLTWALLILGLLILLVLLFLIYILMRGPIINGPKNGPKNGPTVEGHVVTRGGQIQGGNPPPRPSKSVDTSRVEQTYPVGNEYRSLLKVSLKSRGENKEWGIVGVKNLGYVGEVKITRKIETNDGSRLTIVQTFESARSLSVWSEIEQIRIDLPSGFQTVLDISGTILSDGALPPGWSEITVQTLNEALKNRWVLDQFESALSDPNAKVFSHFDSLEGKKVRITYVNGEGVTEIEAIQGNLNESERDFIFASSVISDTYVLPDLNSKPGDTWTVYGSDMLPVIDPSLRATVSGSLTVKRGADGGTGERPTAEITLERGILELNDASNSEKTRAKWSPRGNLTFDFHDGIVSRAELGGSFRIEQRSTDHLIFESSFIVEPQYKVLYQNEVQR